MRALKNVKEVELMGMPKLKRCTLMGGLKNVKSVRMENAGKLESVKGLKEVMEEERKRKEEERKKREEKRRRREEEKRKRKEEEMKRKREEEERKRRDEEEKRRKEEEERKRKEEEDRKKAEEEKRKREEIRRKREEINRRIEEMNAMEKSVIVKSIRDWNTANCNTGVIVIASNCCNDWGLSVLDLSRFVNLRELKVGGECFENVKEVKLIGLKQLERVVIGGNCFTKQKDWNGNDPNRRFYLKNCERLRELKMGLFSFSDYTVCKIENLPSLEVIEMGLLNIQSWNFYSASLELKSDSERIK